MPCDACDLDLLLHCSRLLGELHVALLRLLQADMEEAHAAAGQGPGAPSLADKAFAQSAACLEEAWAWGFDVDVWRAHLNALTWPEVLSHPHDIPSAQAEASDTILALKTSTCTTAVLERERWHGHVF